MSKLLLSPLAQDDLQEIRAYITDEYQNSTAADKIIAQILKKLRILVDFPFMGASLSSVVDVETEYRFLVCGNYTAFYRYEGKTLYIVRLLHCRRDFMKILFGYSPENYDDSDNSDDQSIGEG